MSAPRVWVFALCRNESTLLPFWLRHYSSFAEQIVVFDDQSDDGTREMLDAAPKVAAQPIEMGGIDEDKALNLALNAYRMAGGAADYCMWVDMDEFIYHPRMLECLAHHRDAGHEVVRTVGFNMMGAPIPADDRKSQIYDLMRTGVRAPVYSKPVVFNPACSMGWTRGKHELVCGGMKISPKMDEYQPDPWRLKLLHYRFMTPGYTAARNARQLERCKDKGVAWSCRPDWTGEHSPAWVERTMHLARDVVNEDACYLPPPFDA